MKEYQAYFLCDVRNKLKCSEITRIRNHTSAPLQEVMKVYGKIVSIPMFLLQYIGT